MHPQKYQLFTFLYTIGWSLLFVSNNALSSVEGLSSNSYLIKKSIFPVLSVRNSIASSSKLLKSLSSVNECSCEDVKRRDLFQLFRKGSFMAFVMSNNPKVSNAVPPAYVIAEELGYFPVTNSAGEVTYIPARVKRSSTDQAIALAEYMKNNGFVMYGSFWCPHCQRQKEMFGREAWSRMKYVECDGRGVDGQPAVCLAKGINGFPTWKKLGGSYGKKDMVDDDFSGEMPLAELARRIGYTGDFNPSLEPNFEKSSGACQ